MERHGYHCQKGGIFMPKVRGAFTIVCYLTLLAASTTAQEKPSGDPIGILLAAGDIAACNGAKDKDTAEILRNWPTINPRFTYIQEQRGSSTWAGNRQRRFS